MRRRLLTATTLERAPENRDSGERAATSRNKPRRTGSMAKTAGQARGDAEAFARSEHAEGREHDADANLRSVLRAPRGGAGDAAQVRRSHISRRRASAPALAAGEGRGGRARTPDSADGPAHAMHDLPCALEQVRPALGTLRGEPGEPSRSRRCERCSAPQRPRRKVARLG